MPPVLSTGVVLLFSVEPEHDPYSGEEPVPPLLAFRFYPRIDCHVLQNYALWCCAQQSCVPQEMIPFMSANPGLRVVPMHAPMMSMRMPRALYEWLAKRSWREVMSAIILNLHLDSLRDAPLDSLAPSIQGDVFALYMRQMGRDFREQTQYLNEHFPSGCCETEHSREVAQLDRALCHNGSGFAIVPFSWCLVRTERNVHEVHRSAAKQLCNELTQSSWKCWLYFMTAVSVLPGVNTSFYADRFSWLLGNSSFFFICDQIKQIIELTLDKQRLAVADAGADAERQRWTYRWYLSHLPQELVTERLIPMLFLDASHMPRFVGKRTREGSDSFI